MNLEKANVILAEGAEEVGLAVMLQDLIQQNLVQQPHKFQDFNRLGIGFGLTVPDAEVIVTMVFTGGSLTIYPGIVGNPEVLITCEMNLVMALSNLQIKGGMPYYFDETGREVLVAMIKRRIKVKGIFTNFPSMIRLTRVLSVN